MSDTAECKSARDGSGPGAVRPVVDPSRCEAKADCVDVCPLDVFEIIAMPDETYRALSLLGKLKARVHGMKMAGTPRADACLACAKCVAACPEQAITLSRT